MKIFVDIDDTICFYEDGLNKFSNKRDYKNAQPNLVNIKKINTLYNNNEITYWTARGSVTGLDWYELTKSQLKEWGCKYHQLDFKLHDANIFVDDKSQKPEEFFNEAKF